MRELVHRDNGRVVRASVRWEFCHTHAPGLTPSSWGATTLTIDKENHMSRRPDPGERVLWRAPQGPVAPREDEVILELEDEEIELDLVEDEHIDLDAL